MASISSSAYLFLLFIGKEWTSMAAAIIIVAVISTSHYHTDQGEQTVLYKVNKKYT